MGIQKHLRLIALLIDWKYVKGISSCWFYGARLEGTDRKIV
jgi:hypothetical protein